MNLKWGLFAPCLNEIELVEAKIEWALERFGDISLVEGHHPMYKDVNESGLSIDGTTEILKSYSDRIKYTPLGSAPSETVMRDTAYKKLNKDLDVVIMCDMDEFYLDKDLDYIDSIYKTNKDLKLTLTNSYIFLDDRFCAPHIKRIQSAPIRFNKDVNVHFGEWHERIFRYDPWYSYQRSITLINDFYGRFLYNSEVYYGERLLFPDIYMLHYKNFKRAEAEKRIEMYNSYGDNVDHSDEWQILEKSKLEYKGEHPQQILKLLKERAGFAVMKVG